MLSLPAPLRRWTCRRLGHSWVGCDLRYEQREVKAWVGDEKQAVLLPATFVCDEICVRCGAETWWPS